MPKSAAILQSNYIPWKGYFDLINSVDEFILYDDMQFTKRDWRNRNLIKTPKGPEWLTIPVEVKGKYFQKIKDTKISDKEWARKHWKTISQNYVKAEYYAEYRNIFEDIYTKNQNEFLSDINHEFILTITDILGIKTKISKSTDYELTDGKTERLISLCKQAGASTYISGPAARDYIDCELFEKAGIKLIWMSYEGYKEYRQLYPPFNHFVSIIDLIFNEGKFSRNYMNSF